jgi:lipoprotein-anchoring transpeptidase ErfK/SrfK
MRRRIAAAGVVAAAVVAVPLGVTSALAAPPADAGPPGNNGTIKLDGVEFDSTPGNEPQLDCEVQVDFYGYDEGDLYAEVTFEAHPPTQREGDDQVLLTDTVFIGEDDNSGGGSTAGLDASETYVLDLTGIEPARQGYHVKLTINADGSQGADVKHKVFWLTPCEPEPSPTEPGTTTSTPTGGGTTTTSTGGTTTVPTTAPTATTASTATTTAQTGGTTTVPTAAPTATAPAAPCPPGSAAHHHTARGGGPVPARVRRPSLCGGGRRPGVHGVRRIPAAVVLVAALAVGACGDSGAAPDGSTPPGDGSGAGASLPSPAPPAATSGMHSAVAVNEDEPVVVRREPSANAGVVETLPDTTRLGSPRVLLVLSRQDGWVEVAVPARPNGRTGWVEAAALRVEPVSGEIRVDVGRRRMTVALPGEDVVVTEVAVGSDAHPTPTGTHFVTDRVRPDDADGPYGSFALGLSAYSPTLTEFDGADGQVGIHGTDRPDSIGQAASNGCVRVPPEIEEVLSRVPLGTPVVVT